MSDILIKNMEKPKSCFTPRWGRCCCFHIVAWDGKGHYCQLTGNKVKCNKVDIDCPIVEVKPLVEKYRLYNHLENKYCEECTKDCDGSCIVEKVLDDIDDFPTVLEASE